MKVQEGDTSRVYFIKSGYKILISELDCQQDEVFQWIVTEENSIRSSRLYVEGFP